LRSKLVNASLAVTNSSATDNNNTTINNQNISVLSSSSPSLPATAIQVNADFNNDGFADLAIGVPDEDVASLSGTILNAGAVNVIYGSASGLSTTVVRSDQFWSQNTPNVENVAQANDHFGSALLTGNFNNDGFADLAIGVEDEDVASLSGTILNAGAVNVIYGSASGLSATVKPDQIFEQGLGDLEQMPEFPDNFGYSLAAGDFNNDQRDDLAVGVPNEGVAQGFDGIVQVIYGSSSGLSTSEVLADQIFQQGVGGLGDMPENLDQFGLSLAGGTLTMTNLMIWLLVHHQKIIFLLTMESSKSSTVHPQVCPPQQFYQTRNSY